MNNSDEREKLIDFFMDLNKLNLDADPDLQYTLLTLKGDDWYISQDREFRGEPRWKQEPGDEEPYNYANNYKFEEGKLTELYLGGMDLRILPDTIKNFKNLRKLFLAYNKLSDIPEELGELQSLEYINLSNNYLKSIPTSLGKLKKLSEVKAENNQINEVPIDLSSIIKY